MFDDKVILCGSSSYEKIFYFNPEFDSLPKPVSYTHLDVYKRQSQQYVKH